MSDRPIDNKCSACGDDCMDTEACFNSGDWCIECCIKAGDPCGHAGPTEPEWHTYVTHLQFSARDDQHARDISAMIVNVITAWQASMDADQDEPLMILPQGYAIEAAHLTDADDWAEHVGQEDLCYQCGKPGSTNRLRTGNGNRWCAPCIARNRDHAYPIEDVRI